MLLKLTEIHVGTYGNPTYYENPILIGTESVISMQPHIKQCGGGDYICTEIRSRAAMVDTFFVKESIEEIHKMYKNEQRN